MQKRKTANPKRKVVDAHDMPRLASALEMLAQKARYTGNPAHKRNPGDFGLTPPSNPRPDTTLCDATNIFQRTEAQRLLASGIRQGLISIQQRNNWPQNVWAVTDNGIPVEAMLENQQTGDYHGYPMLASDPLRAEILARWRKE